MARGAAALGLGVALTACGGSQKKSEPAPSAGLASEEPTAAPRDLTPAEAPAGTFVWGRVKDPAALADSLTVATGLPLDWRNLLNEAAPELFRSVNTSAPIELAVAVNPNSRRRPLGVVSWGVASEQIVLQTLGRQNIVSDEGPGGVHAFAAEGASCMVGPSLGPTPARVVCSKQPEALDLLSAFALRGMPEHPLSEADVHLEVVAAPLQQAYGQQIGSLKLLSSVAVRQIQIDNPRFDRAAADAVFGAVDEVIALSQGADRARVQLWNKGGDYELSIAGSFRSEGSWFVETLGELEPQQSPPPDWFWALPSSASAAYFGQRPSKARIRPLWNTARDALAGYLEQNPAITKATRERVERWMTDALVQEGPFVVASGPIVAAGEEGAPLRPAWALSVERAEPAHYVKLLSDMEALLAAPDLRKAMSREGTSWLPEVKRRGALEGKAGSVVYEWNMKGSWATALEGLRAEAGGLALGGASSAQSRAELDTTLESFGKGFVAVVPDADKTWVVWAPTRQRLAEPFGLMARADVPRLRTLAGLRQLESSRAVLSGYYKLEGLLAPLGSPLAGKGLRDWGQVSRSLPHRGQVPVAFEMRVKKGQQTELEVVQRIPRQFLADLTAAISQGFMK